MNFIEERFETYGIIPVVKITNHKNALKLGETLIKASLPIAEITFRTDEAENAIKTLSEELPELLTGAGTVLTAENAKKAAKAGAKFIVSPGLNPQVVSCCLDMGIPVYPGINSPSQIEQGMNMGLSVFKFFPSEASGGLKAIKAISAAYENIKFIPTGGIDKTNIGEYIKFSKILACGGSWIVKDDLISSCRFDEIANLTEEALLEVIGFKNTGFDQNIMNIKVNRLKTAKKYLENKGLSPDNSQNEDNSFYLNDKIGNYTVKIFQN